MAKKRSKYDFGDGRGPVPAHRHANGGGWVDDTAEVDPTARVQAGAVVGAGAAVMAGSRIGTGARVGAGARVGPSANVSRYATVGQMTVIGRCASIGRFVILGRRVSIGETAIVGQYAVVEDGVRCEPGARVMTGVSLFGGAVVDDRAVPPPGLVEPVVPHIDAAILAAVKGRKGALRMDRWHTCDTTHCRAGWAIRLAGEDGKRLERVYGPEMAGTIIYQRSRPGRCVPDFYASDWEALADIRECAAADPLPTGEDIPW
jgi:carbonic anhydrase/acetyltransferase-like protein (isoleucine patch superfamily)